MQKERRAAPRVRVTLPARWEGVMSKVNATICDLSRNGCFVLSSGEVQQKELIWLEIHLPDQEPVRFWSEVVDTAYEIGFAVKFNSSPEGDEDRLYRFVENALASQRKA